ncbi:sugar O-acetyltransferase [uncultured Vibrio sp.]|uniref:sugar O-acetyltransferase n=1 Tax=uncultured Vibrio sp. TaxID=114054 RepID=UPI0025E3FB00|nr:sugar O-acetyltransferase [uncultured Vibrio sp.]
MTTEFNKMMTGQAFNVWDDDLKRRRQKTRELTYRFNQTLPNETDIREGILQHLFSKIGNNLDVSPPLTVDYGDTVYIGDDVFINSNFTLVNSGKISIGSRVMIAPNVSFFSINHGLCFETRKTHNNVRIDFPAPITVEDDVWIGGHTVVLAGVTIGKGSVIGAGSVVTKDIPPNTLACGNPAKIIRQITKGELPSDF